MLLSKPSSRESHCHPGCDFCHWVPFSHGPLHCRVPDTDHAMCQFLRPGSRREWVEFCFPTRPPLQKLAPDHRHLLGAAFPGLLLFCHLWATPLAGRPRGGPSGKSWAEYFPVTRSEPYVTSLLKMYVRRPYSCHELFGFDIMLDENLKPWVLEVNISPR